MIASRPGSALPRARHDLDAERRRPRTRSAPTVVQRLPAGRTAWWRPASRSASGASDATTSPSRLVTRPLDHRGQLGPAVEPGVGEPQPHHGVVHGLVAAVGDRAGDVQRGAGGRVRRRASVTAQPDARRRRAAAVGAPSDPERRRPAVRPGRPQRRDGIPRTGVRGRSSRGVREQLRPPSPRAAAPRRTRAGRSARRAAPRPPRRPRRPRRRARRRRPRAGSGARSCGSGGPRPRTSSRWCRAAARTRPRMPVSSSTSRTAASSAVSPSSRWPLGSDQSSRPRRSTPADQRRPGRGRRCGRPPARRRRSPRPCAAHAPAPPAGAAGAAEGRGAGHPSIVASPSAAGPEPAGRSRASQAGPPPYPCLPCPTCPRPRPTRRRR